MNPLEHIIAAEIAARGPMRLDRYMALCLGHSEHGYYMTRDPLGVAGDFTTAPEVSQMFGELIGAWLAQVWSDQGSPADFLLVELGPGRGTLMRDALRTARGMPGFIDAARVWFVETSPVLRARQAEAVGNARWADRIADLPDGPIFVVANEFFDALPIRQFQRVDTLWRERFVGEGLSFRWSDPRGEPDLDARFRAAPDGAIVETCAAADSMARELASRIARWGGCALVIDYGAWDGTGDSLQAVRNHSKADPLSDPGRADLTAHVRFRDLAEAAQEVRWNGPVPQGVFLERLGITTRARALARGKTAVDIDALVAAHRRLTHPEEMGHLFQSLALTPHDAPVPPGFEP